MLYHLLISTVIDDNHSYGAGFMSIYLLKLYISLLSSSWGMAKFLQLGPCQLIPQKKTGIVMLLVTISNFLGLLWKIIIIPTVLLLLLL